LFVLEGNSGGVMPLEGEREREKWRERESDREINRKKERKREGRRVIQFTGVAATLMGRGGTLK
jgi:hypothetical protein